MRYTEKDYTKIDESRPQKIATNKRVYFTKVGSQDGFTNVNGKEYPTLNTPNTDADINNAEVKAFAKYVENNDYVTYWIKVAKNGRLYNPYGINTGTEKQFRDKSKPNWQYRKVDENIFLSYIEFLKTKNASYLNQAERERV